MRAPPTPQLRLPRRLSVSSAAMRRVFKTLEKHDIENASLSK